MPELPLTNAPPWIQTITARFCPDGGGVQTFSVRQSSDILRPISRSLASWTQRGPVWVASRTPGHGGAGAGG